MGMYATATLFYGYIFEEDFSPFDEDDEELDIDSLTNKQAIAEGHVDPWKTYPDNSGLSYEEFEPFRIQWEKDNAEALDAWYDALREIERRTKVELGTHCHHDYPMYYLAVKGTETNAHQGDPTAIDEIRSYSSFNRDLDEFLETHNIEKPEGFNQPGWWMVSSYG